MKLDLSPEQAFFAGTTREFLADKAPTSLLRELRGAHPFASAYPGGGGTLGPAVTFGHVAGKSVLADNGLSGNGLSGDGLSGNGLSEGGRTA